MNDPSTLLVCILISKWPNFLQEIYVSLLSVAVTKSIRLDEMGRKVVYFIDSLGG